MVYNIKELSKKYMMIPIDDLIPNRFIPRNGSDLHLDRLKHSIELFGIIHPLIVHRVGDMYEVISGERRRLAASIAGLSKIPAIVYNHIEDSNLILLLSCIENIEREALDMSNIIGNFIELKTNCIPNEPVLDVFLSILPANSNTN